MTTYDLNANTRYATAAELQKVVGTLYHLGLSATVNTPSYPAPGGITVFYGYMLEPDNSKNGGFRQRSDTAGRDALVQTASPNLIDRLLAFYPRVTFGDASGGGYQQVWLVPNKYFDSDLDTRNGGFLQLRAQWARATKAGLTVGPNFQVVAWNGDFWYTFGESSGNVYSVSGGATGTAASGAVLSLDTDGSFLYAGTATGLWQSSNGTAWTQVTSSINGTATQWWVVNQGTNGYFAYYQSGSNLLYKVDLIQTFPVAAAAQPQVPVGSNAINIVDLCEYQTSIAVLTTDLRGPGSDVWYFDGNNLTRIVRLEGYRAQGICQALGALYVGAYAVGQVTSPILAKIESGSFEVVAKPGSPFPLANQSCLQPRSSAQYVYWPILNPSINGIGSQPLGTPLSGAPGMVLQYDVLSGAVTHLPNQDSTDFIATGGSLRAVALLGDNVAACYVNGTTGVIQYQLPAFGTIKYQPSGWLVSSKIDFATPGIHKRFRRIDIDHAALRVGETVNISAFVDSDPLSFTSTLATNPASAYASSSLLPNTGLGSTRTSLFFGSDTVAKTLYFAAQLLSGTNQNTSPRVSSFAIEVGGSWTWPLTLACTSKIGLLDGQNVDQQGTTAKDLAYLPLLAYEQGANLTLYHRNGSAYTVAIESFDAWNPSPQVAHGPQEVRDEEWIVQLVLRQVI